jgi:hypothetical protein
VSDGWYCATAVCRVCEHSYIAVFPEACDEDYMECPRCGNMTSEAVEYHGPQSRGSGGLPLAQDPPSPQA